MAKQYVENLNSHAVQPVPWQPDGLPGGAWMRVLSADPVDGAVTGIVELPADFDSGRPLETQSDFQCFVLTGRLALGDRVYGPGDYCFHPPGSPLGRWRTTGPVRALLFLGSRPGFAVARGHALPPKAVPFVDSFGMNWIDPLAAADPSTPFRTGVCVKVLRTDPDTGESTHLAGLLPGWFMPGMEIHPVYEENYCLSGDVCVADVAGSTGYTMTEGVFLCRPAGIAHGPIVSKNGNVNLVYAHGRLGIDYVEHPRATALIDAHLRDSPWR